MLVHRRILNKISVNNGGAGMLRTFIVHSSNIVYEEGYLDVAGAAI